MRRLRSRLQNGLEWRIARSKLAKRAARRQRLARRMGFTDWMDDFPGQDFAIDPSAAKSQPQRAGRLSKQRPLAVASVCTVNYVHFARTLAASVRRAQPDADIFVLVVDATDGDRPQVASSTVITGEEIGFPPTPFQALELSATELCCIAKPFLLRHLLTVGGYSKLIYVDSDIVFFSSPSHFIEALDNAEFVVTPHLREPFHRPENPWELPSLGSIAVAGTINAGLFGMRTGTAAHRFIDQWIAMVDSPRVFEVGEHEQNAFNWLPCFAESVDLFRHPSYNVAYWNLHERSLRCLPEGPLGSSPNRRFLVEDEPLVAFHFSGFDPQHPSRFSKWDQRTNPYNHGPLARLLELYADWLEDANLDSIAAQPYRFDRFPSGIRIDARMRKIFKKFHRAFASEIVPWTPEGEAHYCRRLLLPAPGSGSLLPILIQDLLEERPDLRALSPHAELEPSQLIRWFSEHGALENGYAELFDRYRPTLPTWQGLKALEQQIETSPASLCGDIEEPLGKGRSALVARFRGSRLAHDVLALRHERYSISPVATVRTLIEENEDLRQTYPDFMFSDADRLCSWLETFGPASAFLPSTVCLAFRRTCQAQSLARIYSLMARHWLMMEKYPLALVGEDRDRFSIDLLRLTGRSPEFDIDDIVMYRWLMDLDPSSGLELVLSLPRNASRRDLATDFAARESLLAPVLGDPRIRNALQETRHDLAQEQPTKQRRWHVLESEQSGYRSSFRRRNRNGVNLFGFFKSPIGLGTMSHGLEAALRTRDVRVAPTTLAHMFMDEQLYPADFTNTFDATLETNIFVSFPHLEEHLLETRHPRIWSGRRNIAYLAWELEEVPESWRAAYRDFDQIWALSKFAADALESGLDRTVSPVPCVLDTSDFPPACSKSSVGLREDLFTVLYVFDPGSSIERKNPAGVIDAFAAAFTPADDARLVIRIANFQPRAHRRSIVRLIERAQQAGIDFELITEPLTRNGILRLISAVDTYISLHRTEGFGLTCAEAMAYGKPTIATGYSGNLTFMDSECSFLVESKRSRVLTPEGPFHRGSVWAEPSIEHAAECLSTVYHRPRLARSIGKLGARRIRQQLSPQAVGRVVARLLDDRLETANVLSISERESPGIEAPTTTRTRHGAGGV